MTAAVSPVNPSHVKINIYPISPNPKPLISDGQSIADCAINVPIHEIAVRIVAYFISLVVRTLKLKCRDHANSLRATVVDNRVRLMIRFGLNPKFCSVNFRPRLFD
jgi:hypothetical protein